MSGRDNEEPNYRTPDVIIGLVLLGATTAGAIWVIAFRFF